MKDIIASTKRLYLVKITPSHFNDLYGLLSNPKVHKYFPKELNLEESEEFFEKIIKHYKEHGYCFWAVIRKKDNIFLGICGLISQIIDGQKEVELGYRFSDRFWSQGYATEAALACIRYGKETLGLESVISLIRPVNLPSIRVAEKNGLKYEKETIFHDLNHLVYRIRLK